MLHEALISFYSFGSLFLRVSLGKPWVTWPDLVAELRLVWVTFWGPFNLNYPKGCAPMCSERGWCGGVWNKMMAEETAVVSDPEPGHRAPTLRHRGLAAQQTNPPCHSSYLSWFIQQQPRCVFQAVIHSWLAQTSALGLTAPWRAGHSANNPRGGTKAPWGGNVSPALPQLSAPAAAGNSLESCFTLGKHLCSAAGWLEFESPQVLSQQGLGPSAKNKTSFIAPTSEMKTLTALKHRSPWTKH